MGVDSTAMLIGLTQRGIRPDLILFSDTGVALVLEDRYRDGKRFRHDEPKAVQGLGIRHEWSELLNRQMSGGTGVLRGGGGVLTSERDTDQKLDPCELDLSQSDERDRESVTRE